MEPALVTSDGSPQSDSVSDPFGRLHSLEVRTTLIPVLHSGNRIPILRAQTEACCGAVVLCIDDLVFENLARIGRLAVSGTSEGGPS